MWLLTPRGFFSAVQKPGDGKDEMLTIRGRSKADLENLKDLLPESEPYEEKGYTDYPWRIRVSQKDWALAVAQMALEINYSNFKDEVKHTQGATRAGIYSRVWSTLLDIEGKRTYNTPSYGGHRSAGTQGQLGGYGYEYGSDSYDTGGNSYGAGSTTAYKKWRKGERAWDSVKRRACTVKSNKKQLRVNYDGDPASQVNVVKYKYDLKPLFVLGDRVYDKFKKKYGVIESMKPLAVRYDDDTTGASTFFTDLEHDTIEPDPDPDATVQVDPQAQLQLPSGTREQGGGRSS